MGGRARAAQRKLEQKREMWGGDSDRSWMKWTRCAVCRSRFCVNNFQHRQIDRERYKFLGHWLCPKCRYHGGESLIKIMIMAKRLAEGVASNCGGEDEDCKCNAHVTLRLLTKHNEAKT